MSNFKIGDYARTNKELRWAIKDLHGGKGIIPENTLVQIVNIKQSQWGLAAETRGCDSFDFTDNCCLLQHLKKCNSSIIKEKLGIC